MSENDNSSLFVGMKLQSVKDDTKSKSTLKIKDDVENPEKQREASVTEVANTICDSSTAHSSFSFIRQTKPTEQTNDADFERTTRQASSRMTTVLDLFQTLDENESVPGDNMLSYSDQLAEILPMATSKEDMVQLSIECQPQSDVSGPEITLDKEEDKVMKDTSNVSDDEENSVERTDSEETHQKYNIPLEPEDNVTLFYSQHSFKLTQLRDEKEKLKKDLCLVYEDIKNKLVSLEENLNSLRLKFDEVLSNDDYDMAAEINEKIEQIISEKYELQSSRPDLLNTKINQYFTDVAIFKDKETKFHEWSLSKYDEFEKQQRELLTEHRSQSTVEIDSKKQNLKYQQDELNRSLEHLELDKDYVNKDKKELDKKIERKLEVFQNRKHELVDKHDHLTQEIDILEKKLEKLKSERKEVEDEIVGEENKMKEVRKEFDSLEMRLRDKSEEIQRKENVLKEKLEKTIVQEKDLEEVCSQNKSKEEIFLKNINYITTHKRQSEFLVEKSQEPMDNKMMDIFLTKVSEENTERLKKLQTLEKDKASKLQDLELLVFNKDQNIMTKKKRLDEIENQIPDFEKSKKLAVTEHNFKEAKRLNDIVKQLSGEVETSKKELLVMENSLKDERSKVKSLKDEFGTLKKETSTATESHNNEVFLRIVYKINDLVEEKDRIAEDDLLEDLRKTELDLLKAEFKCLGIPSEELVSKMSDIDQQNLTFVNELLQHEIEVKDLKNQEDVSP